MEPSSDLDRLNSFLKSGQRNYDLPELETAPETRNFLEEALRAVTHWLSRLFESKTSSDTTENGRNLISVMLILAALSILVLIVLALYRAFRKAQLHQNPRLETVGTLTAAVEIPTDTTSPSLPLNIWLRLRWKEFLKRKKQRLSVTPFEFSLTHGKPDPAFVSRINEAMFWNQSKSLSRDEWEQLFQGLEKEG